MYDLTTLTSGYTGEFDFVDWITSYLILCSPKIIIFTCYLILPQHFFLFSAILTPHSRISLSEEKTFSEVS
jgi:hypothetical protein